MLRLVLVRHAKSSWDEPALADVDRPLAPRGRTAAAWIGETLESQGWMPDRVLCSPARRTRETLELALLGSRPAGEIVYDQELYERREGDYVEVIAGAGQQAGVLMLVGHNPAMASTTAALVDAEGRATLDPSAGFPTGAIAVMDFDIVDWAEVATGTGRVVAFLPPPRK